jgi:2-methylcitrate dehydratase PrpD
VIGKPSNSIHAPGKEIIEYISRAEAATFPGHVIHQAQRVVLDCLAAIAAGAAKPEALSLAGFIGTSGGNDCSVFGSSLRASCALAAFVNASYAQVHDFNDGHIGSGSAGGSYHPGRVLVPAALAVGEKTKATGLAVLGALVVGYDVATRVRNLDYKAAPVPDAYAAAAVSGRLMGASQEHIRHALGIAGCFCPCKNSSCLDFDTDFLVCGAIARAGIEAAQLACLGLSGPPLNDNRKMSTRYSSAGLGSQYEIMNLYFKPYPTCRVTHGAIDIILDLRVEHGIRPDDVRRVTVRQPMQAMYVDGKINPDTYYKTCQINMQYPVACAILDGKVCLEHFTRERIRDPKVQSLAQKIDVLADESLDAAWVCAPRPAAVEIEMQDGTVYSKSVKGSRGEGDQPLTDRDLEEKFIACATPIMTSRRIDETVQAVWTLDRMETITPLLAAVSAPRVWISGMEE